MTLVVWTNLTVSLDDSADRQYPLAESARSDLRGITAAASAIADRHPLVCMKVFQNC